MNPPRVMIERKPALPSRLDERGIQLSKCAKCATPDRFHDRRVELGTLRGVTGGSVRRESMRQIPAGDEGDPSPQVLGARRYDLSQSAVVLAGEERKRQHDESYAL